MAHATLESKRRGVAAERNLPVFRILVRIIARTLSHEYSTTFYRRRRL